MPLQTQFPATFLTSANSETFLSRMLATQASHLLAAWPLDETNGVVAYDASENGRNGTYNSNISDWLPTENSLGTTWPHFDGTRWANIYSESLRDAFNGNTGTACVAVQFSADEWTDGVSRRLLWMVADNDNFLGISKSSTSHLLTVTRRANGTTKSVNITTDSTDVLVLYITWDSNADEFKAYINGVQTGTTKTANATFVGTLVSGGTAIGAGGTSGVNPHIGNLGFVALWDIALTLEEIGQASLLPPLTVSLGFSDAALRFVWQTDSHAYEGGLNPGRSLALAAAIDDVNEWQPNAYVHTGDHGENLGPHVREALRIERSSGRPEIFVIGNHDEEEYTGGVGNPNTAELEGKHYFNQAAPFTDVMHMTSGDGTLTALCLILDCNFYDVSPDGTKDDPNHEPGDRFGMSAPSPGGEYWRQFGAAQLAWVEAQLSADTTAQIVLVFTHYPPAGVTCTDFTQLADKLQADGRPAIGFCGHHHQDAIVYTLGSTDEQASYPWYKMPATQESSCWTRVTLSFNGSDIVIDSMEVHNFTQPGEWVIHAPFTLAA